MDYGCSRWVLMVGSRRWRTLGGRRLGWLVAAFELSRRRIDTHTERKRVEPPPLWFAGLFQPWVAPRRRVTVHEENGDNICEGGIAWVSADRGMRGGDLRGLGAGMGRHRRGALGPEVGWFTMAGQPLGPVAGGDCSVGMRGGSAGWDRCGEGEMPEVPLAGWVVAARTHAWLGCGSKGELP